MNERQLSGSRYPDLRLRLDRARMPNIQLKRVFDKPTRRL